MPANSYLDSDTLREKSSKITSLLAEALFDSYTRFNASGYGREFADRIEFRFDDKNNFVNYDTALLSSCFRGAYKAMTPFCEENALFLDFSHEEVKLLLQKGSVLDNIMQQFCKKDYDEALRRCENFVKERDSLTADNHAKSSEEEVSLRMQKIEEINEQIQKTARPKPMSEEDFVDFLAARVQEFTTLLTPKAGFEQMDRARWGESLSARALQEKINRKLDVNWDQLKDKLPKSPGLS